MLWLGLGEEILGVQVWREAAGSEERVVLCLPGHVTPPAQVGRLLRDCLQQRAPQTGIGHIPQGQGNCCIAAVAMIAGVTYEQALAAYPGSSALARGVRPAEMERLLTRLTGTPWHRLMPLAQWRLEDVHLPDRPFVVYLRLPWRFRLAHSIVVKGRMVHDPNYTHALLRDQYPKRHWRVICIFQAGDQPA
jgi:hypothetical protein